MKSRRSTSNISLKEWEKVRKMMFALNELQNIIADVVVAGVAASLARTFPIAVEGSARIEVSHFLGELLWKQFSPYVDSGPCPISCSSPASENAKQSPESVNKKAFGEAIFFFRLSGDERSGYPPSDVKATKGGGKRVVSRLE